LYRGLVELLHLYDVNLIAVMMMMMMMMMMIMMMIMMMMMMMMMMMAGHKTPANIFNTRALRTNC